MEMHLNQTTFRALVLELPETSEGVYRSHSDFRVSNRGFAILGFPDSTWAVLRLPRRLQTQYVFEYPDIFVAVLGSWGAGGATKVKLGKTTATVLWPGLVAAWNKAAPRSIAARYPDLEAPSSRLEPDNLATM
jgi:hypothetical protein